MRLTGCSTVVAVVVDSTAVVVVVDVVVVVVVGLVRVMEVVEDPSSGVFTTVELICVDSGAIN